MFIPLKLVIIGFDTLPDNHQPTFIYQSPHLDGSSGKNSGYTMTKQPWKSWKKINVPHLIWRPQDARIVDGVTTMKIGYLVIRNNLI